MRQLGTGHTTGVQSTTAWTFMRTFCYAACSFLIGSTAASASSDQPILGKSKEYDGGPYTFRASPISFRGRQLGYAEAGFKLQPFSKYWVYQECVLFPKEPGAGDCRDWKILDSESGRLTNFRLPDFAAFWSTPALSWPYVAYVKQGKLYKEAWQQEVYCTVFDYNTKKVVQQKGKRIDASHFETDFPGLFPPPLVVQSQGTTLFKFSLASDGSSKPLCEISIP